MFFLSQKVKSFNVEATNNCRLKCRECDRTLRPEITKKIKDLDVSLFEKLIYQDLKNYDISQIPFNFCGIYGDNLYHKKIIDIFRIIKSRNGIVRLETNGSYYKNWDDLFGVLDKTDQITFSIDGLEDTNQLYRKNSKWSDIINAIEIARKYPLEKRWKYIVFKHNQHQIEEAKQLAKELEIDKFLIRYSGRFRENDDLRPQDKFVGIQQQHKEFIENNTKDNIKITPRCMMGKNIGITYEGYVIPCLTFHSTHNPWFEKNKSRLSLFERTLEEILSDKIWYELQASWKYISSTPEICVKYCGGPKNENTELARVKKQDYNTIEF